MEATSTLPKQAIKEFKRLYKDRFNKELSNEEAIKRSNDLFSLYKAIYGSSKKAKQGRDTTTL